MSNTNRFLKHPGAILADVKIATFVEEMALGIAHAQRRLDRNSVKMAIEMAKQPYDELNGKTLLQCGLSPAFYHFPEMELKVSMMLRIREERDETKTIGLHGSGGNQSGYSKNTTSMGTATLRVTHRPATAARALVDVTAVARGELVVGETTFGIVTTAGDAPGGQEEVLFDTGDTLLENAQVLADAIVASRDATGAPVVASARVRSVQAEPPDIETDSPAVFGVDERRGRIRVTHRGAQPAIEIVSVSRNNGGTVQMPSNGGGAFTVQLGANPPAGHATIGDTPHESSVRLADAINGFQLSGSVMGDAIALVAHFAYNVRATWLPESTEALEATRDYLRENPDERVLLFGFADSDGPSNYNLDLSRDRARVVAEWLQEEGIAEDRIDRFAGGEAYQVSSDNALNRRVEIRLTTGGGVNVGTNLVALRSAGRGAGVAMDTAPTGSIETFWGRDGLDPQPAGGETVTVEGETLTLVTGAPAAGEFQRGGNANATATNLAAALTTALPALTFRAVGPTVHVEGPDTIAQIELTSAVLGPEANRIALTAEDAVGAGPNAVTVAAPFRGGRAAGELTGATVAVGDVRLVAGTDFEGGGTQDQTAANIQAALSQRLTPGFTAAAAGPEVRVTGPSGTPLLAAPPRVLSWDAAALPGEPSTETISASKSLAWGATFDSHSTKKFEIDITGYSELKVRMVAIPAPVEFLDEIKAYLEG